MGTVNWLWGPVTGALHWSSSHRLWSEVGGLREKSSYPCIWKKKEEISTRGGQSTQLYMRYSTFFSLSPLHFLCFSFFSSASFPPSLPTASLHFLLSFLSCLFLHPLLLPTTPSFSPLFTPTIKQLLSFTCGCFSSRIAGHGQCGGEVKAPGNHPFSF